MPKKKTDKKIECFSAAFNDILICEKSAERPYIEAFVEEPENVTSQNLGILAGILEITDKSEDSSYIVNYLVSVIKKEYYARPKRGVIESFEAALKKANLALAKLAEHETIGWIGHTNAILLVIDKNNLHLSQSGSARALLLRGKTLTDLSDGGVSAEPNPIKTFTDIVSGRLEENDKLIITTDAMFDLFSFEEIKKSALRFSSEEFLRFLKTALVNETERSAALVIEIKKEVKAAAKKILPKKSEEFNAFSQKTYIKKPTAPLPAENFYAGKTEAPPKASPERQNIIKEIQEELAKNDSEFVDKKTGHIYIKEDGAEKEETSSFLEMLGDWQEKFSGFFSGFSESFKSLGQKIKDADLPRIKSPVSKNPSAQNPAPPKKTAAVEKHIPVEKIPDRTEIEEVENRFVFYWKEYFPRFMRFLREAYASVARASRRAASFVSHISRNAFLSLRRGFSAGRDFWLERRAQKEKESEEEHRHRLSQPERKRREESTQTGEKKDWMEKYEEKLSGVSSPETISFSAPSQDRAEPRTDFGKFLPRFSRLKKILLKLDYTQKIYVALAIILLFVVPYFLAKIGKKPAPKSAPAEQVQTAEALPLAQDKNVVRPDKIDSVYSGTDLTNVIDLGGSFYAVSASGMVDLGNGNTVYPWPDNFSPNLSAGMNDLNMIFILGQDQRLIAWSPVNKKFQDNSVNLPPNAKIVAMKTYLTYLYVLDSASGQIWRYPRADNGFGDQSAWLKNPDESSATAMAVSDNIYLSDGQNISKFLQGQKQDFSLGETATPIKIEALYAKRDYQNLYILDKTNGRVIKTTLDGQIEAQYYNAEIKNAVSFSVDEENNIVYFSSPTSVEKFEMK